MSKRKRLEQELEELDIDRQHLHKMFVQERDERSKYASRRQPCEGDTLPTPRVELRMKAILDVPVGPGRVTRLRATLALVWHDDETSEHVTTPLKVMDFDATKPEPMSDSDANELFDEITALGRCLHVPCFAVNVNGQIREVEQEAGAGAPLPPAPAPVPAQKSVRLRLVLEDWVNKETGLSLLGSDFGRSLEQTCIEVDADLVLKGLVGSEAELEVLKSLQDASDAGAEPLFTLRAPEIMG